MAGAKETPRQKMISMMYLVLTALLAMNVSVDILDAFSNVNEGLERSNISVENKIESYYLTFEQQYNKQPEKVQDLWDKANLIRNKTDEIINYIEREVKIPLVLATEGLTEEEFMDPNAKKPIIKNREQVLSNPKRVFHELALNNVAAKDKYDIPTNFMIENGKATELKEKIKEYRSFIVTTVQSAGVGGFNSKVALLTDTDANGNNIIYTDPTGVELSWENKNFYHMILAADISIINKIIGEIQTTEFDAVSELFKSIGATDYKFNALEAKVLPKSTYVIVGRNYEADVFIAAQDTTKKFDVRYSMGVDRFNIENTTAPEIQSVGGVVKLKFPATTPGFHKYAGVIEMADPVTGEVVPYPFSSNYTVAPPSATIAPTQMMIFYQGLKNPISVSAPGVAHENIRVTVSNGATLTVGEVPGTYFVEVAAGTKNVTVTASGELDGAPIVLGSYEFRVKRVPSPEAQIAGVSSGKIAKDDILAARGIVPNMGDFEFGDYSYRIVSFKLSTIIAGDLKEAGTNNGGVFNAETLKFIQNAGHGQKLYFENITAKGPDGMTRTLNPINIEIK